MNKQAILIMAHNNELVLDKLIKELDSIYFDIYLHIDKKSYLNIEEYTNITKISKIYVYKEIDVVWGDYSQVECELFLIKEALKNNYEYLHLLSGSDMLLKTPKYIYEYFHNSNKEYIHFQDREVPSNKLEWINNKTDFKLMTGANWFSITNEFAKYLITKEELISNIFKGSRSPDEFFIQTIIYNSKYKDNLYNKDYNNNYDSIKRLIDWDRGIPYVWRVSDYEELINSDMFFVRKINQNDDYEIAKKLYDYIDNLKT